MTVRIAGVLFALASGCGAAPCPPPAAAMTATMSARNRSTCGPGVDVELGFSARASGDPTVKVIVYTDEARTTPLATVPTGHDLTVLVWHEPETFSNANPSCLVKTEFGLVGWAELAPGPWDGKTMDGVNWYGD